MMLCDVVGRLFQGVCKKGAVHHGLFLLGPPAALYYQRIESGRCHRLQYDVILIFSWCVFQPRTRSCRLWVSFAWNTLVQYSDLSLEGGIGFRAP